MIQREWILWIFLAVALYPLVGLALTFRNIEAVSSPWALVSVFGQTLLFTSAFLLTVVSHIVLLRRHRAARTPSP